MDVPETTAGELQGREAAADLGAAAPADGCPVDHPADRTTSAEPAAPHPQAAIPAAALPGPRMHPVAQIYNYWKHPAAFMERCRERYGSRFMLRIRIPPVPLYVITDPEDVRQMFLAPPDVLHTGLGSSTLEKFTGQTGLAWLDEDEHTVRKRQLLPITHGKALDRIEASITEMARRDVATWPRGRTMAMYPLIHRYVFNAIREVIFGPATPSCWDELLDVLLGMMRLNDKFATVMMIHKMPPALVRLLLTIRPLGLHEFMKLRKRADALIAEAIQERRSSGELGDDMLSVLLGITYDDGSPLSGVELRDEMMTIFLAGTETTAAGLTWAFEYLSREHAVRDRLVAEIDAGESDAYLTATVHEVLRLRPPLSQIIPREVMKPIEIGGVRYERGMLVMASGYLLHRDPSVYPDPCAFRPERFLGTRPGTYTWIPFGGGRTRCLGPEVGILEMKAVLREVLANCELRRVDPEPESPRTRQVVTVPRKGTRLELIARSPEASLAGA
jgi:cytochrome P450